MCLVLSGRVGETSLRVYAALYVSEGGREITLQATTPVLLLPWRQAVEFHVDAGSAGASK